MVRFLLTTVVCNLITSCLQHELCNSRTKNPCPPHGRSSPEIPRGEGVVLKAKILVAKYEAILEFLGGRGGGAAKQKTFHEGSMDIFWIYTLCHLNEMYNFFTTVAHNAKNVVEVCFKTL